MPDGVCRLCGQTRELRSSHVFPQGIYKRFVADNQKGGSLLDLKNMAEHSMQFKGPWLCGECEGKLNRGGENYFFALLNCGRPITTYEPMLYYFAVSISWRCALLHFESNGGIDQISGALDCWRRFLLGKSRTAEPYSQYLLSLDSPKWERWNRGVGGFAYPNHHLVFSTLGPSVVLGITHPDNFTDADKDILAPGQLHPSGGTVHLDEPTTDAALTVEPIRGACNFWQAVGIQRLSQLANKLTCSKCGKSKKDCKC